VHKLTDGVVGNGVRQMTFEGPHNKSASYLLDKQSCENKPADTEANNPVVYSLQESCDLLQSSYDDLYDDDGDETSSVEAGVITGHDDATTDSVGGPLDSVDGPLNQSFTSSSDLEDDTATSADCIAASDSDFGEPFRLDNEADLYTSDVWQSYYSRLQEIGIATRGCEGWPNFDAIFMISAVDNDGVFDVKVNNF